MKQASERRNPNVLRVDMTTLVDICLSEGDLSPFQGECANVSGRGMHVRTSFLPDVGEGLVCRFEHDGREVLVEGKVAWRSEGADGGEFGVQFTALDGQSAEVLKSLGDSGRSRSASARVSGALASRPPVRLFSLEEDDEEVEREVPLSEGDKVKLHVDGLKAPMSALVHEGTARKVRVGSSLEFLKLGRSLSIEGAEGGAQRGAHVDSVNVVVNPKTSVPELIVMLRYDGLTPTPAPAHAFDVRSKEAQARSEDHGADQDVSPEPPAVLPEAVRPHAEAVLRGASLLMKTAQTMVGTAGRATAEAFEKVRGTAQELSAKRRARASSARSKAAPDIRRRTTAPPSHLRASLTDPKLKTLRAQVASPPAPRIEPPVSTRARASLLAGATVLLLGGSALTLRALRSEEPAPELAEAQAQPSAASDTPALPVPVGVTTGAASATGSRPASPEGIVAEVPLFGARAVAEQAAAAEEAPLDDLTHERLAAAASTEDQAFPETAKPKDEPSFAKGKLRDPIVYRIRLDGSAPEISGRHEAKGFSLLIPGRKAMESGRNVERRDARLARVKASNTASGASIRFEFKGEVPAYRIRAKGDYLEVALSAPPKGLAQL